MRDYREKIRSSPKKDDDRLSSESAFIREMCGRISEFYDRGGLAHSGVSKHMTFCCEWFSELHSYENEYISLGNGIRYRVMDRGTNMKRVIDDEQMVK